MKRWLLGAVVIMLGLMSVMGCAAEPVGPQIVDIELYAPPARTRPYAFAVTLSRMLEERHPWLRASVVETLGSVDRIHTADALPPERRKFAFHISHSDIAMAQCLLGEEPYKRKFTDLRYLGRINMVGFAFVSYNPEIKTPQDLIGKTVCVFPVGSGIQILTDALLKDAWGIYDEVRLSHHRPPDFKDVLITGLADIAFVNATPLVGGRVSPDAGSLSVISAKKTYWIDVTQEDIDRINQKNTWVTSRLLVPKGSIAPESPPEDTALMAYPAAIVCWDEAPEEIVHELLKFMAENSEEWSRRLEGDPMSAEYLANLPPDVTEDQMHPGALRFFKEQGIKIGG